MMEFHQIMNFDPVVNAITGSSMLLCAAIITAFFGGYYTTAATTRDLVAAQEQSNRRRQRVIRRSIMLRDQREFISLIGALTSSAHISATCGIAKHSNTERLVTEYKNARAIFNRTVQHAIDLGHNTWQTRILIKRFARFFYNIDQNSSCAVAAWGRRSILMLVGSDSTYDSNAHAFAFRRFIHQVNRDFYRDLIRLEDTHRLVENGTLNNNISNNAALLDMIKDASQHGVIVRDYIHTLCIATNYDDMNIIRLYNALNEIYCDGFVTSGERFTTVQNTGDAKCRNKNATKNTIYASVNLGQTISIGNAYVMVRNLHFDEGYAFELFNGKLVVSPFFSSRIRNNTFNVFTYDNDLYIGFSHPLDIADEWMVYTYTTMDGGSPQVCETNSFKIEA